MSDVLRILGQSIPSAGILTDLYVVPASTQTSISSLIICNQNNAGTSFNVSLAINGAADAPAQYIFFQAPLDVNDSFIATIGISLATGDVLRCLSSTGSVSFNLCGVEVPA